MTESQSNQWPADKIVRKNVSKLVFYARNSPNGPQRRSGSVSAGVGEGTPSDSP